VDSLSDKNPLVKQIRRAVARGTLTEDGYAVAEGIHLLEEALAARREIGAVIVSETARETSRLPQGRLPQARVVSEKTFRDLSSTESPQGVLALVRPAAWTLDQILNGCALVVVLDGVQDPGNAGAILRAAEAFGATGAVFLKGTVNPYNPKCLRGSAGSVFRLPIVMAADLAAGLDGDLGGLRLYAAMPRARQPIEETDFRGPCGIVIGGEGRGVSAALETRVTSVRIPTSGVESLNAAVAAGIMLYEARRQRTR
jgi:TrmH family RNA methyltransferase